MAYRALLITDGDPPRVMLRESLLPDHAAAEVGGAPAFGGPAPWGANHDLLIDPDERTLCGIVYPVRTAERAAVLRLCGGFPSRIVRYCVSPRLAARLVMESTDLWDVPRDWGDPAARVRAFPTSLRPFRQLLRACLLGTHDRSELPPEIREEAAQYFTSLNDDDGFSEWPGGDVDRVEVVWEPRPVIAELPSHFPSMLQVEIAQQFAEDIWFYRKDGSVAGIVINHLDSILDAFHLDLPPAIGGRGA